MSEPRDDFRAPGRGTEELLHSGRIAETHDETFRDLRLLTHDLAVVAGWLGKPGKLLDLGCGTGRTLVEFGRRGFGVTGVDLNPQMVEISRRKVEAAGLKRAKVLQGDLSNLPMDRLDPPYDYAVCLFSTLSYVAGHQNRLRAVRQAASLLAPGGQYVLHTWNLLYHLAGMHLPWILTGLAWWAVGRGEIGDEVYWTYLGVPWVRLHAFTAMEIRRLVRDAGLDLAEIYHMNKRCDGPLAGRRLKNWRSNGFLVRCVRPRDGA